MREAVEKRRAKRKEGEEEEEEEEEGDLKSRGSEEVVKRY